MNLRHLEFFVTLAKLEHMTEAATVLNTTQPNISHAINVLEDELGTKLFEKKGRNIILTKYGRFYLEYVERGLGELKMGNMALKQLHSPTHGNVDIGFIYTIGYSHLPIILENFRSNPENENFEISLYQGVTKAVLKQLIDQKIDLAICSLTDDPRINFEKFAEQDNVLVVPIDHPLAKKDEVSIKEIPKYPFINVSKVSGLRKMIDEIFDKIDSVKIAFEVAEDHTIVGLVERGFGIAIVPNIKTINAFNVKALKITDIPSHRQIYLATLKDTQLSPAALRFKEFATEFAAKEFKIT